MELKQPILEISATERMEDGAQNVTGQGYWKLCKDWLKNRGVS